MSTSLTAVGTGKPMTVLIKPVSCVSAVAVTVTVKPQLFCNPAPSVTVQVTPVVPIGKVEPDAGVQLVMRVPQLSLAVGAKLAAAPLLLVAVAVWLLGQVRVGGV